MAADGLQRGQEELPAVDVDPLDDPFERRLGVDQVAILLREAAEAGFQRRRARRASRDSPSRAG